MCCMFMLIAGLPSSGSTEAGSSKPCAIRVQQFHLVGIHDRSQVMLSSSSAPVACSLHQSQGKGQVSKYSSTPQVLKFAIVLLKKMHLK